MRYAALMSLLAFAAAACAAATPSSALATATPARTLPIELRDTAFAPARLEVAALEVVDLALKNTGAADHDFTIDTMPGATLVLGPQTSDHQAHASKAAAHAAPGPGKSVSLRLKPTARGEYVFYCSIAGHREAGMTGTLVVS